MNKDIVLFDMDGTLTEARKPFAPFLSSPLWSLAQVSDIGIVTGSDMDYVKQQMSDLLDNHSIRYCLHILPCNGTKWYLPPEFAAHEHSICHSVSMEDELGKMKYRRLLEILCNLQSEVASDYGVPLAGHFISPRGSMINWSPSGRLADEAQRAKFKKFDKNFSFRSQMFMKLRLMLDSNDMQNVVIKLGGDTSFDIYPTGWDKTYALRHFGDRNVWFVGDRARSPKGNDYEIFKACEPRSFHTDSPEYTREIIIELVDKIRGGQNETN